MTSIVKTLVDQIEKYRNEPPQVFSPRRRLLIVDDNEDYTRLLSDVFTAEGYDVTCVHDPTTALQKANDSVPFSCIVMDLNFPGKDSGVTAIQRIREVLPNVPVTILSGFLDTEGRFKEVAEKLGIKVFSKTSDFDALKQAVVEVQNVSRGN